MAVDHIRYDLLAQQALRGVVRSVLTDAAKSGLPGDHHFFIAFDTQAPGVRISARLREQYPQEMTIILQHQFWDLSVTSDGFEVGLSFGGISERLSVPFAAIKGFFDPSVQFGLQFEAQADAASSPDADLPAGSPEPSASKQPSPKTGQPVTLAPVRSGPMPETAAEPLSDPPDGGAEVVKLDRFRKKEGRGRTTEDGTKRR